MTEDDKLLGDIASIIKENSSVADDFDFDENLLQSGTIDSFSVLQIFLGLQSKLGANIDIEDITEETFATVRSIGELIKAKA